MAVTVIHINRSNVTVGIIRLNALEFMRDLLLRCHVDEIITPSA